SFKARGAAAKLTTLSEAQKKAGVIAMSAGNHAQGVAFHAGRLSIPATIVMPKGTPFNKMRKTRDYGGTVILDGDTLTEAAAAARRIGAERGLTFIHPYDDEDVIAGQGVIGLEIMDAVPDAEIIIVPIGGGGLIAGVATAAKSVKPGIAIVGAESALYPSMKNAVSNEHAPSGGATVAEGIAVADAGALTAVIVKSRVSDVLPVSETNLERGIAMYAGAAKTVAEGAGAASLAALLQDPARFKGRKVVLLLSGGNIDSRLLSSILMRDLVRVGQVLTLSIALPDRPGSLESITAICASEGANVIEVSHRRLGLDLAASAARLDITIETRDQDHAAQIIARIRAAGFEPTVHEP
ncbi:MAG: pyridoxal-phosphate dependent enzyme, partial [Rhodospirillaceae bacterium]|nr:pyridoxal-phosphate dependent enzyme [Rhodospirillaceae bacterium]